MYHIDYYFLSNCFVYGARFYDPAIGRFTTVDPLTEQFPHQSGYVYADNDPVGKIDFMGMNGQTVIVGKEDQQFVLDNLHERTDATYTFNENNELIRDESVEQSSDAYSDAIDQAISAPGVLTIAQEQLASRPNWPGILVSIDADAGGGMTTPNISTNPKGEDHEGAEILVTGNGDNDITDNQGNIITYSGADILLHEIVGHGLPALGIPGTGNAI